MSPKKNSGVRQKYKFGKVKPGRINRTKLNSGGKKQSTKMDKQISVFEAQFNALSKAEKESVTGIKLRKKGLRLKLRKLKQMKAYVLKLGQPNNHLDVTIKEYEQALKKLSN
jgi:hypothetical protein